MAKQGKPTSVRLSDDVKRKLDEMAEKEQRSLSNAIDVALTRYFKMADKGKERHV